MRGSANPVMGYQVQR